MCSIFSLIWIIILAVPAGWHNSHVYYILRFETSLYHVTVKKGAALEIASLVNKAIGPKMKGLDKLVDTMSSGTYGLVEMKERMSIIPGDYYNSWQSLVFASYLMMFMGICVVIFYWLAAGFLFVFWSSQPTETGRKCGRLFLIVVPTCASIGMLLYFAMTVGFGDAGSEIDYGAAFICGCAMVVCSFVPLLVYELFVNHHAVVQVYEARLKKDGMVDYKSEMRNTNYGSMQRQSMANTMGQQPHMAAQSGYGGGPGPGYGFGPPQHPSAAPYYPQQSPSYGQQPPSYGQQRPPYGAQPGYGGAQPGYGGYSYNVNVRY
jgi:hypothetical protein